MATPFLGGRFQAIGAIAGGVVGPVPGAALYTYSAGTLTPAPTYTDASAGSANANPVVCDSSGQADVWLAARTYRMRLYTRPIAAGGVLLWDEDNISGSEARELFGGLAAATGAGAIGYSAANDQAAGTLGAHARLAVHVKDAPWLAKGDGTTDDTAALQAALDWMATQGGGIVHADGGRYRLTARLRVPSFVLLSGAQWLPDPSNLQQIKHTALYVDWGAGADEHAVEMAHSSGIEGFTFFYPGQVAKTATTPVAFGYSISTPTTGGVNDNIHIRNVTLFNSYKGIRLNNGGRWRVDGVQGDPLFVGITADECLDVCYLNGVHFWNFYCQNAALETWVSKNAVGFDLRRVDQLFADKLFVWNRSRGIHCRDGLWANFVNICVDKADYPFTVELSSQITVNSFVLITNANVRPAIWGRYVQTSARFSNGRITTAGAVGVQIDDGIAYQFDNVDFGCPHVAVVNLSPTTDVRVSDTCRWSVPPWGAHSTMVNGERLPSADVPVPLPTPDTSNVVPLAAGWRIPLDAVGSSVIAWDTTAISQRNGMYVLEFDYALTGPTLPTTWYFQVSVKQDTGANKQASFEPAAPLILNAGGVRQRVRVPFFIGHGRFKQVLQVFVQVTAPTVGASVDITNVVLSEQSSAHTTDAQVANMGRSGYYLDAYGKGQTLFTKGKSRRIYTEPEPGIGRTGATPTAGTWEVGDEVLLDAPAAGASPGVICTTAGTFGGSAPVFKALPAIAA